MTRKRVLITGASGRIASTFFRAMSDRYTFTLVDVKEPSYEVGSEHKYLNIDLSKPSALREHLAGIDVVLHLAGNPDPAATFEQVLHSHMLVTTYVLESVSEANCGRFIYASSAQTIEGYPVDVQVNTRMAVNPANLYGVSKCYGEALCAYYSSQKALSTLCVRIGAFEHEGSGNLHNGRDLSAWLAPADAVSLLERCIETPNIGHAIVHGISDNRFKRLDLSDTSALLGYAPQANAFAGIDLVEK
jgi:uronate dehydrogenase